MRIERSDLENIRTRFAQSFDNFGLSDDRKRVRCRD